MGRGGMAGHESPVMQKDEWLTPPELVKALGDFDLDPCAPINRPWDTAKRHLSILDNGLDQPWHGRVWMNPPYGPQVGQWLKKLVDHGDGIALIFARTETVAFHQYVWNECSGILFLRGRLTFFNVDGTPAENSAGAPSCLVAYGTNNLCALENSGIPGKVVGRRFK